MSDSFGFAPNNQQLLEALRAQFSSSHSMEDYYNNPDRTKFGQHNLTDPNQKELEAIFKNPNAETREFLNTLQLINQIAPNFKYSTTGRQSTNVEDRRQEVYTPDLNEMANKFIPKEAPRW